MATTDLVLETSQPALTWRQKLAEKRLPWIPISVLLILLICAVFAHWLAPHDPESLNVLNSKLAPFANSSHILGTDVLGRDMVSRLIYGARTTAQISVVALTLGAVIGTVVGLVSGYWGGWADAILMRITDAALGFPTILLALVVVVIMDPGPPAIILAVLLTVWARFARMIRGDVLTVKGYDFVTLAKITGVKPPVILWRHIFPNVANTLMVITSLMVGQIILLEAALSFLGLGLSPGAPAWGIMVAEGQEVILDVWWLSLFPGLAITIVVLAFNFFGDWLRDYMDPKLRRSG